MLPGKVTGSCIPSDELARWIEANIAKEAPVNRKASSDDLIAYHLQNAREPNAYSEMAAAMESFRAPRPWAGLLNKVSREHAPKKMQKRYIELDEVNGLLQSLRQLQCEGPVRPGSGRRGRHQAAVNRDPSQDRCHPKA